MLATLTALVVAAAATSAAPPTITFDSLLREMTDRAAVSRWPEPEYRCIQFSSYDRASRSPEDAAGWFANNDVGNFLRVEHDPATGRTEHVMVDCDGPGAVVRIWSANPKGTLRVYLDGSRTPVLQGPMKELLSDAGPIGAPLAHEVARGFNLYLPIPFASRCVISSDEGGFYYQVNVRRYETSSAVASLSAEALARALDAARTDRSSVLAATQAALVARPAGELPATDRAPSLDAGAASDVTVQHGPGQIVWLGLHADAAPGAARSLVLVAEFDGRRTIECPLGDLLGCGADFRPVEDWYRHVRIQGSQAEAALLWVMPYREGARLRLENRGASPIAARLLEPRTEPAPWTDRSMHFHVAWRSDPSIPVAGARGTLDWTMLAATGSGVLVGDTLSVVNPVEGWWGEGDEKIFVDGESFPSHFGTGTEDYYGYAWCSNEHFANPFHGQPRCDGRASGSNWGHTTVSRLRSLDAVPFERSLRFDMEIWHWVACDMSYAAATCFYARPGIAVTSPRTEPRGAALRVPDPPPLPPPYRLEVPGAQVFEAEALPIASSSAGLPRENQDLRGFARSTWSGDRHLWVKGRQAGDFIELALPSLPAGRHAVRVVATRSFDYGRVRFSLHAGDRLLAAPVEIDLFAGADGGDAGKVRPVDVDLGLVEVPAGTSVTLRSELVGRHAQARGAGAFWGIDAVVVTPR